MARRADPKLPKGVLDGVLFKEPGPMLARINEALKPGGRLVVIDDVGTEHRKRSRSELTESHEFTPDLLESELRQAGFEPLESAAIPLAQAAIASHGWWLPSKANVGLKRLSPVIAAGSKPVGFGKGWHRKAG